jgi:hypothetical protein
MTGFGISVVEPSGYIAREVKIYHPSYWPI